jgi:hypothetical protein
VWEGFDASDGEAPVPMIFATHVWSATRPNMHFATPDEKKALIGHEMMVGFVKGQGAKSGLPVFLTFLRRAFTTPRSVKHGWFMVSLFATVVALQLMTITGNVVTGQIGWHTAFTAFLGAIYAYCVVRAAQGLRRLRKERAEEQRVEKEKEEFDRITAQLPELGTLDE